MTPSETVIHAEAQAPDMFRSAIASAIEAAEPIWQWGDGSGGYLVESFMAEMRSHGLQCVDAKDPNAYRKDVLPAALKTAVMERDFYRCRSCGTHLQLTVDHVIAEVNGGPSTLENLQTLCKPCNSRKGRS